MSKSSYIFKVVCPEKSGLMIVKIVGLIFAIGIDGRDERNDPVGMAGASVGWQQ